MLGCCLHHPVWYFCHLVGLEPCPRYLAEMLHNLFWSTPVVPGCCSPSPAKGQIPDCPAKNVPSQSRPGFSPVQFLDSLTWLFPQETHLPPERPGKGWFLFPPRYDLQLLFFWKLWLWEAVSPFSSSLLILLFQVCGTLNCSLCFPKSTSSSPLDMSLRGWQCWDLFTPSFLNWLNTPSLDVD